MWSRRAGVARAGVRARARRRRRGARLTHAHLQRQPYVSLGLPLAPQCRVTEDSKSTSPPGSTDEACLHLGWPALDHRRRADDIVAAAFGSETAMVQQDIPYPDGAGSLIVEGPFPYKNGPSVFSDSNLLGAYGMVVIPGTFDKEDPEAGCTPVPAESPFASSSSVYPVKMTNGLNDCLLGCNWTEVEATGMTLATLGHCRRAQGYNSVMSCFKLGPGTEGHGGGACGYVRTSLKTRPAVASWSGAPGTFRRVRHLLRHQNLSRQRLVACTPLQKKCCRVQNATSVALDAITAGHMTLGGIGAEVDYARRIRDKKTIRCGEFNLR